MLIGAFEMFLTSMITGWFVRSYPAGMKMSGICSLSFFACLPNTPKFDICSFSGSPGLSIIDSVAFSPGFSIFALLAPTSTPDGIIIVFFICLIWFVIDFSSVWSGTWYLPSIHSDFVLSCIVQSIFLMNSDPISMRSG